MTERTYCVSPKMASLDSKGGELIGDPAHAARLAVERACAERKTMIITADHWRKHWIGGETYRVVGIAVNPDDLDEDALENEIEIVHAEIAKLDGEV